MTLRARLLGRIDGLGGWVPAELARLREAPMQTSRLHAVGLWGKWNLFTPDPGWHPAATATPRLRAFIEARCDMDRLRVAHVFYSGAGGYLHPHRDWPEERPLFLRIHIPLQAGDECLMSEGRHVFRMAVGEAWLFCASQVHSAGAFSEPDRFHLVLDFDPDADLAASLKLGRPARPRDHHVPRPSWSGDREAAFLALAGILGRDTFAPIAALASSLHYQWELDAEASWPLLSRLAERGGDPRLVAKVEALRSAFLVEASVPKPLAS